MKYCAKGGRGWVGGGRTLPVSFISEGSSMLVRGYTVYVYIIYFIYIYIYIQIDIYIFGFSAATGKVLSFEVTKY